MKGLIFFVLLINFIFLCPNLVYAGMGYHLKCDNCQAEEDLLFGIGMVSKVVANGYCYNCKKYVSITHGTAKDEKGLYVNYDGSTNTQEQIEAMEKPLGYVYQPALGKIALYPCPICGQPFIPIKEEGFGTYENPTKMYCPICNKKALQGRGGILWD